MKLQDDSLWKFWHKKLFNKFWRNWNENQLIEVLINEEKKKEIFTVSNVSGHWGWCRRQTDKRAGSSLRRSQLQYLLLGVAKCCQKGVETSKEISFETMKTILLTNFLLFEMKINILVNDASNVNHIGWSFSLNSREQIRFVLRFYAITWNNTDRREELPPTIFVESDSSGYTNIIILTSLPLSNYQQFITISLPKRNLEMVVLMLNVLSIMHTDRRSTTSQPLYFHPRLFFDPIGIVLKNKKKTSFKISKTESCKN